MLEFKKVSKIFGKIKALDNVSFKIDEGEFVFLTGPSGAGKTTILRLTTCEYLPSNGKIFFDGHDLTKVKKSSIPKLRQKIGAVFQDYKLIADRTVRENIEIVLAIKGLPSEKWQGRTDRVIELVGLLDRTELFPSQLSGGELQRVALARALVVDPKLIFADEPTGNLDWETAEGIVELLKRINKEGKTVIFATHSKTIVEKVGGRIIELEKGKVVRDTEAR